MAGNSFVAIHNPRRVYAVFPTTHRHVGSVVRRLHRIEPTVNHGLLGDGAARYVRSR
jgi:hypothetical protein